MCWITLKKEYTQARVAQEDIPVFKLAESNGTNFESVYFGKRYDVGTQYEEAIYANEACDDEIPKEINHALHSYSPDVKMTKAYHPLERIRVMSADDVILDGLVTSFHQGLSRLNCVIPNGTMYFLNEHGEYASEALKVISAERIEI